MQIEVEKIARSPSRTGRELQRYNLDRRQVVGCIPYRFVGKPSCSFTVVDEIEVLLISSQKSEKMMFPKGGWESDESMEQAVLREALEEAGVTGQVQHELGKWSYKSKSQDKMHDGFMFPMLVDQEFHHWPEKDSRKRKWVNVEEAKKLCPQWMNEALDSLIERLELEKPSDMEDSSSSPSSSSSSSSSSPPPPQHFLGSPPSSSSVHSSPSPCHFEAEVTSHRKKMRTQLSIHVIRA